MIEKLKPDFIPAWRLLSPLLPQAKKIQSDLFALTPTESAVAVLVADGKTNSEIAGVLHLASGTIKNYVSVILQKVHLTNRAALAVYATTHNLRAGVVNTYQADSVTYDPDCYRDLAFLAYV